MRFVDDDLVDAHIGKCDHVIAGFPQVCDFLIDGFLGSFQSLAGERVFVGDACNCLDEHVALFFVDFGFEVGW